MYFDKLGPLRTKRAKMMTLWTRRLMFRHSNVKPSIFLFDLNGIEWRSNYKFSEKALTHLLVLLVGTWYIHKICTKKKKNQKMYNRSNQSHVWPYLISKQICWLLFSKHQYNFTAMIPDNLNTLSSLDKVNMYFFSSTDFFYLKQGIK